VVFTFFAWSNIVFGFAEGWAMQRIDNQEKYFFWSTISECTLQFVVAM
jgi:hypothetical protein